MKQIMFTDTAGPGLPCIYKIDLEAGLVWVQKSNRHGTVFFQKLTSAPRIKRVLKRAKEAQTE